MVRMSKSVEYAMIAIAYVASRDGLVRAREIASQLDLPAGLLAKILQRLAVAGILSSEQGAHGGYRIARDPDTVSFLELSEAVDGRFRFAPCADPDACERRSQCSVAGPVHELGDRISHVLSSVTIGALLAPSEVTK